MYFVQQSGKYVEDTIIGTLQLFKGLYRIFYYTGVKLDFDGAYFSLKLFVFIPWSILGRIKAFYL